MTTKASPKTSASKQKYNQSETIVIKRSLIKAAPYNPRKEDAEVVRKLKKNFKSVGFLGGVVWNKLSGYLVSGHKRIQTLDIINCYDGGAETDYDVKVEAVELDDKTEREQNIFMNSPSAMGGFDTDKLRELIPDLDYQAAGLTDQDLSIIGFEFQIPEIDEIVTDLSELSSTYDERKEAVKQMKAQIKQQSNDRVDEHEAFVTLSFDTYKAKTAFMRRFGFASDEKFIKGELFSGMIERIE